ncbi:MAG TPA: DUF402 domain-containing protein [Nocardioides sp.]|nr:DUF402 domain-containing protein [Nocardioides sp.]
MHRGDRVRIETTKWGDRPHWVYDAVWLGTDGHGEWLGCPRGTHYARPGMAFDAAFAGVVLVPAGGAAFLAALNDGHATHQTYVDIATPPQWDGSVLRTVDLDLDVVRLQDGTVYLDDEDEFAEHQVAYGYPVEVVAMAEASAAAVLAAVRAGDPPFDGVTSQGWIDLLG